MTVVFFTVVLKADVFKAGLVCFLGVWLAFIDDRGPFRPVSWGCSVV